jgi:hypothetical protein
VCVCTDFQLDLHMQLYIDAHSRLQYRYYFISQHEYRRNIDTDPYVLNIHIRRRKSSTVLLDASGAAILPSMRASGPNLRGQCDCQQIIALLLVLKALVGLHRGRWRTRAQTRQADSAKK